MMEIQRKRFCSFFCCCCIEAHILKMCIHYPWCSILVFSVYILLVHHYKVINIGSLWMSTATPRFFYQFKMNHAYDLRKWICLRVEWREGRRGGGLEIFFQNSRGKMKSDWPPTREKNRKKISIISSKLSLSFIRKMTIFFPELNWKCTVASATAPWIRWMASVCIHTHTRTANAWIWASELNWTDHSRAKYNVYTET